MSLPTERLCVLIGNYDFDSDSGFDRLATPGNDLGRLESAFSDKSRGSFKTTRLENRGKGEIIERIQHILLRATPENFALIYYSGHGFLDASLGLCLASKDTRRGAPETYLHFSEIHELVRVSEITQAAVLSLTAVTEVLPALRVSGLERKPARSSSATCRARLSRSRNPTRRPN